MTNEEYSSILNWYGGITATISIFLSLYTLLRDRARISISYQTNQYLHGSAAKIIYHQTSQDQKYVIITVANKGRRAIRIEQAALKIFRQKEWAIFGDSFGDHRIKILNEATPTTTFIAEQEKINLNKVIYVRIQDGTGKVYKKYIKKFPTIYLAIDWMTDFFSKK